MSQYYHINVYIKKRYDKKVVLGMISRYTNVMV